MVYVTVALSELVATIAALTFLDWMEYIFPIF